MLDRDGPIPVYVQIAQIIHGQIASGEYKPGDPLPSEAQLEAEYGIAKTTARRVARELRERGLAHTVQGEGTFAGDTGVPRARTRVPVYQQIAEEIAAQLERGELLPNRPIPSEKALMQQYDRSKVTIRQAVACLREAGWVFTVAHRGTYVSPREKWPEREV